MVITHRATGNNGPRQSSFARFCCEGLSALSEFRSSGLRPQPLARFSQARDSGCSEANEPTSQATRLLIDSSCWSRNSLSNDTSQLSSTWCLATALAENIFGLVSLFVCLASCIPLAPGFPLPLNPENNSDSGVQAPRLMPSSKCEALTQ